jgi:KDO2-lipid IV(A) lauroyltransferase
VVEHFVNLRDDGRPAVIFGAHIANWELVAVAGHVNGLKSVIPFRAIRNAEVAEGVYAQRNRLMGHLVLSGRGALFEITAAMEAGEHLGMLVDQRLSEGIFVPFFGRPALTNPLPARFARWFECPVHGARAIRKLDGRLHIELTPPIDLPRDRHGRVDVKEATVLMTRIVEGWVREHPDQYFWPHDRWKGTPEG